MKYVKIYNGEGLPLGVHQLGEELVQSENPIYVKVFDATLTKCEGVVSLANITEGDASKNIKVYDESLALVGKATVSEIVPSTPQILSVNGKTAGQSLTLGELGKIEIKTSKVFEAGTTMSIVMDSYGEPQFEDICPLSEDSDTFSAGGIVVANYSVKKITATIDGVTMEINFAEPGGDDQTE